MNSRAIPGRRVNAWGRRETALSDGECREVLVSILDQCAFFLADQEHLRFLKFFDVPPVPSAKARARLNREALWKA